MKTHLQFRADLQICKAHMINAMEKYLSSIINNSFAKPMSVEFVAQVGTFDLSKKNLANAIKNAKLFIYPSQPEKYSTRLGWKKADGSIDVLVIHRFLNFLHTKNEAPPLNLAKGFDKNILDIIFKIFSEEGIEVLNSKIYAIDDLFESKTKNGKNFPIEENSNTDQLSIRWILELIKEIDPLEFDSKNLNYFKLNFSSNSTPHIYENIY